MKIDEGREEEESKLAKNPYEWKAPGACASENGDGKAGEKEAGKEDSVVIGDGDRLKYC